MEKKGKMVGSSRRSNKKAAPPMRRPKTHPELLNREKPSLERTPWLNLEAPAIKAEPKNAAKLLVNITVSQSIGALRVLVSESATVSEVRKAALDLYSKEGRRPVLNNDPLAFDLHYSQFSIDCLNSSDKIKDLGSRNFFLCPKACTSAAKENGGSCGCEVEKNSKGKESWYKLMDCFLLLH